MKLYRVMCRAEFEDLKACGYFRGNARGFTEAKWFAERLEDACKWGRWFGEISGILHDTYIMIEVSDELADQFVPIGRRDGIGLARCARLELIKGVAWTEVTP